MHSYTMHYALIHCALIHSYLHTTHSYTMHYALIHCALIHSYSCTIRIHSYTSILQMLSSINPHSKLKVLMAMVHMLPAEEQIRGEPTALSAVSVVLVSGLQVQSV
jgi:hypothetical protein